MSNPLMEKTLDLPLISGEKSTLKFSYFLLYICGDWCIFCVEMKIMPTKKPRYTITLDEEMLKKIDDFRFENRFPNRTQATLELIRIGMEALEKQQEKQKG